MALAGNGSIRLEVKSEVGTPNGCYTQCYPNNQYYSVTPKYSRFEKKLAGHVVVLPANKFTHEDGDLVLYKHSRYGMDNLCCCSSYSCNSASHNFNYERFLPSETFNPQWGITGQISLDDLSKVISLQPQSNLAKGCADACWGLEMGFFKAEDVLGDLVKERRGGLYTLFGFTLSGCGLPCITIGCGISLITIPFACIGYTVKEIIESLAKLWKSTPQPEPSIEASSLPSVSPQTPDLLTILSKQPLVAPSIAAIKYFNLEPIYGLGSEPLTTNVGLSQSPSQARAADGDFDLESGLGQFPTARPG